jgi:hypothetical protein
MKNWKPIAAVWPSIVKSAQEEVKSLALKNIPEEEKAQEAAKRVAVKLAEKTDIKSFLPKHPLLGMAIEAIEERVYLIIARVAVESVYHTLKANGLI